MPVKIYVDGKEMLLSPTTRPKTEKLPSNTATIKVDRDYYVYSFNAAGE
jgi:hypothetical protein